MEPASGRPFVPISCTTLSEHLLESQLFGHVKGAFTGAWTDKAGRLEAAAGGTLFLDEIGELRRRYRRNYCVFSKSVDSNVSAAGRPSRSTTGTGGDQPRPRVGPRSGTFRKDLFHRLNVLRIELPPLRDRSEDLIPWRVTSSRSARLATDARRWRCSLRRKRRSLAIAGPETYVSSSTCWHMQSSSAAATRSRSMTCRIGCKPCRDPLVRHDGRPVALPRTHPAQTYRSRSR